MNKLKKTILITIAVLTVALIGRIGYNLLSKPKTNESNKTFAIYIDEGDGNGPVASTSNKFPTNGYEFDETNSYCENNSTLSWDSSAKTIGVTSTTGDKCKLYFTKLKTTGAETLITKANAASVTTYSSGTTTEMYTFTHSDIDTSLATQVSSWTSDELTDYRYIGANPNNYVYFNCTDTSDTSTCEVWRIIGVFTVEDENGTKAQRIKLIRNATIGNLPWNITKVNNGYVNEWAGGSLATLLNSGDYYTRSNTYATNGLTVSAKNIISEKALYYLGGIASINNKDGSVYYSHERGTTVYSGRSTSVVQEVGIMYPSDYVYTYADGVDNTCYTNALHCNNGTPSSGWIYNTNTAESSTSKDINWTICPYPDGTYMVNYITAEGYIFNEYGPYSSFGVRPVVYLNSDVQLDATVGDGSSSSPYRLVY